MEGNSLELFQIEIKFYSDLLKLKAFLWEKCAEYHCARTIDKTTEDHKVVTTAKISGEWEKVFMVSGEIAKFLEQKKLIGVSQFSQIEKRLSGEQEVTIASLQKITPADIRKKGSSGCKEKNSITNVLQAKATDAATLKNYIGRFKKYFTLENFLKIASKTVLEKLHLTSLEEVTTVKDLSIPEEAKGQEESRVEKLLREQNQELKKQIKEMEKKYEKAEEKHEDAMKEMEEKHEKVVKEMKDAMKEMKEKHEKVVNEMMKQLKDNNDKLFNMVLEEKKKRL